MGESCKKWKTARVVAETKERCDYISHLPDHVLASILSFLPIKQAVRTCILSQRWMHIWNLIPNLKLDEECAFNGREEGQGFWEQGLDLSRWVCIIYQILLSRQVSVQSCVISNEFLDKCSYDAHHFILLLMKLNIEEIVIDCKGKDRYRISHDLLHCQYLRVLKLSRCKVKLPPPFGGLCYLKTIDFFRVCTTDDVINHLISSSKLLERLALRFCPGLRYLKIHASNLLYLDIRLGYSICIYLENTTCLLNVYLGFFSEPKYFREDQASMLGSLITSLTVVETLALRSDAGFFQFLSRGHVPESFPSMYLNLKKLAVNVNLMDAKDASLFASFIRNCPFIKDIELWIARRRATKIVTEHDFWEKQRAFDCVTHHLQTVRINLINLEREQEYGFLKFLVVNAYVLERISVIYCRGIKKESRDIEEELLPLRVSSHAHLILKGIGA